MGSIGMLVIPVLLLAQAPAVAMQQTRNAGPLARLQMAS
jgi:hypothetical protein